MVGNQRECSAIYLQLDIVVSKVVCVGHLQVDGRQGSGVGQQIVKRWLDVFSGWAVGNGLVGVHVYLNDQIELTQISAVSYAKKQDMIYLKRTYTINNIVELEDWILPFPGHEPSN